MIPTHTIYLLALNISEVVSLVLLGHEAADAEARRKSCVNGAVEAHVNFIV